METSPITSPAPSQAALSNVVTVDPSPDLFTPGTGEPNAERDKSGRFLPGRSPNAKGRPRGVVDRRAALRRQLEKELPDLLKLAIQKAKAGDVEVLKFLLARTLPVRRADEVYIAVPDGATLAQKAALITSAALSGHLPPETAVQLGRALQTEAGLSDLGAIVRRLEILEQTKSQPPRI